MCFALGAADPYVHAVGESVANTTFFVGSLGFTAAAFLQYRAAVRAAVRCGPVPPTGIDWWATSVQLLGTLAFNVSTAWATIQGLTAAEATRDVWAPDAVGSICFLVASALAWAEAGHAWLSWRPRRWDWWIAAANGLGSIAFALSAVGAFVLPATGTLWRSALAANTTLVGALCFLIGAIALLPERTATRLPPPTPAGVASSP